MSKNTSVFGIFATIDQADNALRCCANRAFAIPTSRRSSPITGQQGVRA